MPTNVGPHVCGCVTASADVKIDTYVRKIREGIVEMQTSVANAVYTFYRTNTHTHMNPNLSRHASTHTQAQTDTGTHAHTNSQT